MQIRRFRGSRTVMSLRLCSRAPWTTSSSAAIEWAIVASERVFVQTIHVRPGPVVRVLAEAGLARVQADVLDRVREVLLGVDDARGEAIAPEVAAPLVARVVALSVDAVQALHPRRE